MPFNLKLICSVRNSKKGGDNLKKILEIEENQGKQVNNNSKNSQCGICQKKRHLEKDS